MNNSQEIILAQISAIYDKPPFVKVKTGQMEMILKCVTIVVDANDFMSNGVLGIDTQNTLFREEGKLCENIDETLKRVLVKKSYDRNNILVLKRRNNNNCYQEQLQYFKNADGKYYSSVILCYPKERIVISHIRLVGLLLNGRFRRMCISE